jgi:molecular chaperone DnaJ
LAYEILSDEKKKANFDKFGSADGPQGFGGGGFGGFDFGGFSGFGDIFENLFEGGGFSFGGMSGRHRQTVKGEDIILDVTVSFEESCNGASKKVMFNRNEKCRVCNGTGAKDGSSFTQCSYCHGAGRVKQTQRLGAFGVMENVVPCSVCGGTGKVITEKCHDCNGKGTVKKQVAYEVNVPAGIDNNQTLTITGEGNAATGGGISGDLHIRIRVIPHPILLREDFDLYMELPITFTEAILGVKVKIPVIGGTTVLDITPNTQNGTVHRLRGKGVKKLRSVGAGDLIVKVFVEVPKAVDKKVAQLLNALNSDIKIDAYKKVASYRERVYSKNN